jgi:hypothetical protein
VIYIDDLEERWSLHFAEEIIYCNEEYYALSETFRAQVTFQQFVSIKNPRWSKDEVTHWAKKMEEIHYWSSIAEENRAKEGKEVDTSLPASRWKEAQIEPTPIRSRELCYSCKEPWEPDHRCRGKGKVHITLRCTMTVRMRRCMRMNHRCLFRAVTG